LLTPKAPYLLGATTAFRVVMNMSSIAVSSSHIFSLDESAARGIWATSLYVFIINLNT